MKLHEIFDTQITQSEHPRARLKDADWRQSRWPDYKDKDTISHGGTYRAKVSKDDSHLVDKESIRPDESYPVRVKDGMRIYAEAIIKNKLAQENPFFPRFYGYHIDKDSEGNKLYKFQTEKLVSADDLEFENILPVLDHIFPNEKEKKRFLKGFMIDIDGQEPSADLLTDDIGWYLGEMMNAKKYDAASDQLNQALRLIRKLRDEHRLADDLHGNNIMYRPTSTGFQMVLNDPLA
jgi:hypothetical protein